MINLPYLAPFYSITHAPFVLGSLWGLHDITIYLTSTFIDVFEGYAMKQEFFGTNAVCKRYFSATGGYSSTDSTALLDDPMYGWGKSENMRHWIMAAVEYNRTSDKYAG
jgi:hypothetical protein